MDSRKDVNSESIQVEPGSLLKLGVLSHTRKDNPNANLSEQHLTIFDFCCDVNAYINQQFASR